MIINTFRLSSSSTTTQQQIRIVAIITGTVGLASHAIAADNLAAVRCVTGCRQELGVVFAFVFRVVVVGVGVDVDVDVNVPADAMIEALGTIDAHSRDHAAGGGIAGAVCFIIVIIIDTIIIDRGRR